jgi:uncharacterized protein YbbC (DUF1343 family)
MIARSVVFAAVAAASLAAQRQSYPGAAEIDRVIEESVAKGEMPGAVVQIGQPDKVLYRKAYGARALEPGREPMTEDTVFDVASLTKVVATTSAMMKLFEQGRVRLGDPVTAYLPEFQKGNSEITVRQLMTHFSGLRPDVDLKPVWSGYETGVHLALVDKPVARPGERFIYSDINFILLGEMVRRLSGKPLPEYVREHVFEPLAMADTRFQPPPQWKARIAPTEKEAGMTAPLRGVVHDPTTRFMGGVAGHAGLFSTAADLGRFAEMILRHGTAPGGRRLFQPATILKFTEPQTPMDQPMLRALGWDMDSRYSANRGELFPFGSFGHTGFTGTSLWMDPSSRTYVILLANSVHPMRRPPIHSLRSRVATIAAAHAGIARPGLLLTTYNETTAGLRRPAARNGDVLTGIDVLAEENFARLQGKRVGLITNHTGLARNGLRNVDVMVKAGVNVVAMLSPEHGITGTEDREDVASSVDKATGVKVVSLYDGPARRPSQKLLATMDVVVFDVQDVGARFYTYMCTLLGTLEEAGRAGVPVLVLDRPNPVTGVHVEGALLDKEYESFVGCYRLPLRHGMTLGEIAVMGNAEQKWNAKLEVVKMKGWQRGDWLDSTGVAWLNPSPNIRSLNAAIVYPAVAQLEYSKNYSVGRGTDSPFEHLGAPWIRGRQLAAYLNARAIPGIRFYPTRFQPESGNLAGQTVEGIRLVVTNRDELPVALLGAEITGALLKLYPGKIDLETNKKLIGNRDAMARLQAGLDPREVFRLETEALRQFLETRKRFLLY